MARALTRYPQSLSQAIHQPLFLATSLFVLVGIMLEVAHADRDFSSLIRFAQTAVGAVLIACLCRTRETLSFTLRSLAGFAFCVSLVLIFTSYGKLSGVDVEEFEGASALREQAFESGSFFRDLNRWSFVCGLGAPVALAMFDGSTSKRQRLLWASAAFVCLLGAAMPLSRSGIMVMLAACGIVLFWSVRSRLRLIPAVAAILILVYALTPTAVIHRFRGTGGLSEESQDPRQRILAASVKSIPEYWLTGVGWGQYWDEWAAKVGINNKLGRPRGAHNSFFQVWMCWGALGLLSFLALLLFAFRCLPNNVGRDPLSLALLALAFAVTFRLFFTHVFYEKDFSAVLGLLAAARLWIWPAGKIATSFHPSSRNGKRRFWSPLTSPVPSVGRKSLGSASVRS